MNGVPPMEKRIEPKEPNELWGDPEKKDHDARDALLISAFLFICGLLFDHWFVLKVFPW